MKQITIRSESNQSGAAVETGIANGYSYRICSTVDLVDSDGWMDVCASADASVFMELPFLRVLEHEHIFASKQHYAMLSDPHTGRTLATAIFTILPVDAAAISGATVRQTLKGVRRVVPNFLQFRVALCGTPLSLGQSNLYIRPGTDNTRVLATLDLLLRRLARKAGTPFVAYKEFTPHDLSTMDELLPLGYQRVQNLPVHLFPTRFCNFEEYVGALKSTHRYTIRKSQKKLRAEDVTIQRITGPDQISKWYTDEVHSLYLAVVERAEYQFEVLTPTFFQSLAREMPENLTFSVARTASGQTIGFLSSLLIQGRYHGLYIGLDYAWNAKCDLYFNLIYSDIEYALSRNAKQIDLAQTADIFKARLGCRHEPRYLYVLVRAGVKPRMMRLALPLLFPTPELSPTFHVFATTSTGYGAPRQRDGIQ